jgi:hypothetical protein
MINQLKMFPYFKNMNKKFFDQLVESSSYKSWPKNFQNGEDKWIQRNKDIINNYKAIEIKSNYIFSKY